MPTLSPSNGRSRRTQPPDGPRGRGWWGPGKPPTDLWPGVTIDIAATWHPKRKRYESHGGKYWFDEIEARRACEFFPECLTHHIGEFAGRRFDLLDYQAKLLTKPIFGWKRASDNLRRFRKVFGFLPKGAGKSPWASGTGLYLMLCDHEPAAEIYAIAGDKNQARVVHSNAKTMVEDAPDLASMCEVWRDSIYCPETRAVYQVLSADAKTKHGFRPHGVVFDEFHGQPNRDLYEAIKKSMGKRRQPLLIIITHAGTDDESICYEEYDYAKRVLSGTIQDETILPVIFEAKPHEDWTDPKLLAKINPGHGITIKQDAVEMELAEAKNEPRKKNDYLRFHLNKWTNQATSWIPVDWWDACNEPVEDDAILKTRQCAAGLDLAQKFDLACFNVVFRHPVETTLDVPVVTEAEDAPGKPRTVVVNLNYRVTMLPFFWIPRDTMIEREKLDGLPYSVWEQMGLITVTEGGTIDYTRIYSDITTKILPRFPLLKQGTVGYDPAFATDIATNLRDRAGMLVMEVLQNFSHLSEPSQVFEAFVKAKRVTHGGHRVLRNHVENIEIKTDDARRIRPVRPKRANKRVDGVLAGVMGLKVLAALPLAPKKYTVFTFGGPR